MPVPHVEVYRLDGKTTVPLTSFGGKPIVINLWVTWCPPCRREMPVLRPAQLAHSEIHFVFVNQGESAATVQTHLDTTRLEIANVFLDPAKQMSARTTSSGTPPPCSMTLRVDCISGTWESYRVPHSAKTSGAPRIFAEHRKTFAISTRPKESDSQTINDDVLSLLTRSIWFEVSQPRRRLILPIFFDGPQHLLNKCVVVYCLCVRPDELPSMRGCIHVDYSEADPAQVHGPRDVREKD